MFAIQVKKIEPSSVCIAKSMLFVSKDMDKYTFQLPTSMVKVDKIITTPVHAQVVLNIFQGFPSSNPEDHATDTWTKVFPPNLLAIIVVSYVDSNPRCPSEGV